MAQPSRLDIEVYRGDTFFLTLRFLAEVDGLAIDLTGRTYAAQLRTSPDSGDPVAFVIDTGGLGSGEVVISLPAVLSAALDQDCVWDFQETSGGVVKTLVRGAAKLVKDVTR